MTTTADDPLRTPRETAGQLGVSTGTLNVWRATKRYPLPYVKIGRHVRYRQSDIDRFIASRRYGDVPGDP
jgi:excisionase family DNA binding protein